MKRSRWVLLLATILLTSGCASLPPAPGRGMSLDATPGAADGPAWAGGPGDEHSPAMPAWEEPERLHRRRSARGLDSAFSSTRGAASGGTSTCGGQPAPPGWPDPSSMKPEALLAPFLACTPAKFVALQETVDMPRLVRALDDWSAVRLGALGPVREDAAEILDSKRASFLVTATREQGPALAEVFALFVLHTSHDDDLRLVLRQLARDKQLGQTLGRMAHVREQLRQRGLHLSDYPDRPERPGDLQRGAREGIGDIVSTTPLLQWRRARGYDEWKSQLPPPYRQALVRVEDALVEAAFSPGNAARGVLDELTFGVPLGAYHLAAGTAQGVSSLSHGQYEQATRELMPAALMVAVYAGGKGLRPRSESRGAGTGGGRGLTVAEWRSWLAEGVMRLEARLGGEALEALARHIRARREAARFVAVGGADAAVALHEAGGNVPRAQAWLSQAKSERPGSTRAGAGAGKSPGASSLVDEASGLSREVLESKLREVESRAPGARLSEDVAVLKKQRPSLEAPPPGARGDPLWSDYVRYFEERLANLEQGRQVKNGRKLEAPLRWESYQKMQGLVTRGLLFDRHMAGLLRADAALPRARRRWLRDFDEPRVETYVGVMKPESGLRFADVLVIEQKPPPGQSPRVETFSFKSRDFSQVTQRELLAQLKADMSEALRCYGETLDIRRPSLQPLLREGSEVPVQRVRLIYEGGDLKPTQVDNVKTIIQKAETGLPGVEVFFQ